VIKLVLEREEITVLCLFSRNSYCGLNREQKWEKAISEGWQYNILRGIWWKEYKY